MAFINKFFASRKKGNVRHQDNVWEKLFAFSNEQVRVVLFQECDFRGRKLLFDSSSIQKIPLVDTLNTNQDVTNTLKEGPTRKYKEISNGFGYLCSKPNADTNKLSEMVFGSVAMSYRGASYKIHSLNSPGRLMCTKVFPSPRNFRRSSRNSVPTQNFSHQNLEHSTKFDDSSYGTSCSDPNSVNTTNSDSLLVCRGPRSVPLDVPSLYGNSFWSNIPKCENIGDSGCGGDLSCSSLGSCPPSNGAEQDSRSTFSSGSLYKRWLRSASTSLDYSTSSLTGSASADECYVRTSARTIKLGLAIIVELTEGQEENMEQFFMEHAALIETMVSRARQGTEIAYTRFANFLSLMTEVAYTVSQWLVNMLSGPQLKTNIWLSLLHSCDNLNSIETTKLFGDAKENFSDLQQNFSDVERTSTINFLECKTSSSVFTSNSSYESTNGDIAFLNFSKFLRTEWDAVSGKKNAGEGNMAAENFLKELCGLLEEIDVKHTNFFLSTLITAVLTHHLGWVSTSIPPSANEKDMLSKFRKPCNPLWGQLTDLYGAIGQPTKVAHTIISGTNKSELISKILNTLTYFIRCCEVDRKNFIRTNVAEENKTAFEICKKNACIPKENFKKYEDILQEIATVNKTFTKRTSLTIAELKSDISEVLLKKDISNFDLIQTKAMGLKKTTTCFSNLKKLSNEESQKDIKTRTNDFLDKFTSADLGVFKEQSLVTMESKVNLLNMEEKQKLMDIKEAKEQIEKVFSPRKLTKQCEFSFESDQIDCSKTELVGEKSEVVFVLGENDELVGLRKAMKSVNSLDKLVKEEHNENIKIASSGMQLGMKFNDSSYSNEDKEVIEPGYSVKNTSLNMKQKHKFYCESSDSSTEDIFEDTYFKNSIFNDNDFVKSQDNTYVIKPSTSWTSSFSDQNSSKQEININDNESTQIKEKEFIRSQSVPPKKSENQDQNEEQNESKKSKYRYSGVKFNFQQYPQVLPNYMRSKNIELSNLPFPEKAMNFNKLSTNFDLPPVEVSDCDEGEALQTPSNASELEYVSELDNKQLNIQHSKPQIQEKTDNILKTVNSSYDDVKPLLNLDNNGSQAVAEEKKLKIIEIPMPKSIEELSFTTLPPGYTCSLMRGISENYISDMVLQGICQPKVKWESLLKRDLVLATRYPLLDQPIQEAVAIVANTDTWEVQLLSSHTYVIDRGSTGVRIGMSQLVANMLESLLNLWKANVPPEYCLMHIEQHLQEFCVRSKAVAQLLLETDFCSIDLLTKTLHLEVNDIPLLMAIASSHSPELLQKYGLSFG